MTISVSVQFGKPMKILGTVTAAATGSPLFGAVVSFGGKSAFTDLGGSFEITNISPAYGYVTVSASGYVQETYGSFATETDTWTYVIAALAKEAAPPVPKVYPAAYAWTSPARSGRAPGERDVVGWGGISSVPQTGLATLIINGTYYTASSTIHWNINDNPYVYYYIDDVLQGRITEPGEAYLQAGQAIKITPMPEPPVGQVPEPAPMTPAQRWRAFQNHPNVKNFLGTLPDTTLNAFSRVFSGYDIFLEQSAAPEPGHFVAVGLVLVGLGVAAVVSVFAVLAELGFVAAAATGATEAEAAEIYATDWAGALSTSQLQEGILAKLLALLPTWSQAPQVLKYLVGAVVALWGTDFFIDFMGEETLQTSGMGVWTLISNKDWPHAKAALDNYNTFIAALEAKVGFVGIVSPIAYYTFTNYLNGAKAQAKAYAEVITMNLAKKTSLTVNSSPSSAAVDIKGMLSGITPLTLPDVAPGNYEITVSAEGYESETRQVVVVEGKDNAESFYLKKTVPTEEHGEISVITVPDKASVFINDSLYPYMTPTVVQDLVPDTYAVRAEKQNYTPVEVTAVVKAGEQTKLSFALEAIIIPPVIPPVIPPAGPGKIKITVSPPGVDVFAGGVLMGRTGTDGTATLETAAGSYQLEFRKDGYTTASRTVTVRDGETTEVMLALSATEVLRKLLRVDCEVKAPDGTALHAKILVNGSFTDKYSPDYVLLQAGDYIFTFDKSGYVPAEVPVTWGGA
jgi:hypothetical protein